MTVVLSAATDSTRLGIFSAMSELSQYEIDILYFREENERVKRFLVGDQVQATFEMRDVKHPLPVGTAGVITALDSHLHTVEVLSNGTKQWWWRGYWEKPNEPHKPSPSRNKSLPAYPTRPPFIQPTQEEIERARGEMAAQRAQLRKRRDELWPTIKLAVAKAGGMPSRLAEILNVPTSLVRNWVVGIQKSMPDDEMVARIKEYLERPEPEIPEPPTDGGGPAIEARESPPPPENKESGVSDEERIRKRRAERKAFWKFWKNGE